MKKKTSLWISGITTVAMLAVAVGSFAAWNQLTADTSQFSATTDTPTVLTVTEGDSNFTNATLAPKPTTSTGFEDDKDVEALTAEFTPTLSQNTNQADITYKIDTTDTDPTLLSKYLKVEVLDATSQPVAENAKLTSDVKYTLRVSFNDTYSSGDAAAWDATTRAEATDKPIKVKVTCTAAKTTV